MTTNFPVSIDDNTSLPNPGSGNFTDNPSHASQHDTENDAIKAVEAKVGIGASTPTAGNVFRGTGTGTSAWAQLVLTTDVTGVLPIANGGTNASTQQTAIDSLAGAQSSGKYLRSDGTHTTLTIIQAADVPTLNQSTSGDAGTVGGNSASNLMPLGSMLPYAGRSAPTKWLMCDGTTQSRTTYATLFGIIAPVIGTFTITIAAPAVVTLSAHGFITGDSLYLTTTSALPTGLSVNTIYYVVRVDANTFNLSTTLANAIAGTKITTTGSQSGTHTATACPYGLGDGSTTFGLPDLRGRVPAGADAMAGASAASRLTLAQTQGSYGVLGASGGEQGHAQTSAELATHNHAFQGNSGIRIHTPDINNGTQAPSGAAVWGALTMDTAGSGTAANVVQPTLVTNYIIKAL